MACLMFCHVLKPASSRSQPPTDPPNARSPGRVLGLGTLNPESKPQTLTPKPWGGSLGLVECPRPALRSTGGPRHVVLRGLGAKRMFLTR